MDDNCALMLLRLLLLNWAWVDVLDCWMPDLMTAPLCVIRCS